MVRELCKYRFRAAFGVWALWCGGAPFGRFPSRLRRRGAHLGGGGGESARAGAGCCARGRPPLPLPSPTLRSALRPSAGKVHGRRQAHAGRTHGTSPISGRGLGLRRADAGRTHGTSPISGRRHGRRQAVAGRTHGQERGLPCALPPLRSALRPSAGRGAAVDKLTRGERTGRSGDCLVHSAFAHSDSDISGQVRGRRQGKCGALREGASAFALALPHPAHAGAGHGVTTVRPLPHSGADTPRERPTGERYINIRVRRREDEHVLHRAASNDVDNFSVDNPLWITTAAGGRSLRGRRRRVCGRSVNAGAEV